MRHLTLAEVLILHQMVMDQTGGGEGLRDMGALESAVGQPRQTFGGEDLYPDLASKTTALAFSLIQNHPFIDGNKRVGHAAAATFLTLNGYELEASVDEAEATILAVAAGQLDRDGFQKWISSHLVQL